MYGVMYRKSFDHRGITITIEQHDTGWWAKFDLGPLLFNHKAETVFQAMRLARDAIDRIKRAGGAHHVTVRNQVGGSTQ